MPEDYENLYNLNQMDDTEIADLVRQELQEYDTFDADLVEIQVTDGRIRVEGRVGTEQEVQHVEHVLSDVLGADDYRNEVVVDENTRAQRAEPADVAAAEDAEAQAALGESGKRTDPAADHLIEDVDGDLYGTHDVQKAIERGQSYSPPDGTTQQGSRSRENH